MPSKLEKAIQILKHVENPSQSVIIDIAKELKCSERWVWEAKARLLKEKEETSEEFNLLKEIASDLIWISSYMEKEMKLKGDSLKIRDKIRLNKISEHIEILNKNIKLQDYMRIKENNEINLFLKDIEGRRADELQEYIRLKEELNENKI